MQCLDDHYHHSRGSVSMQWFRVYDPRAHGVESRSRGVGSQVPLPTCHCCQLGLGPPQPGLKV